MTSPTESKLLQELGSRLRRLRIERGLTQRDLALRAGLSGRFVVQVEAGRGNIALTRLASLARALDAPLEALVADLPGEAPDCGVIALIGLRGAGKSTLGPALAARLGLPFVEHDELIEASAGMALAEVRTLHGEAYCTRLARRSLDRLLVEGAPSIVLAAADGAGSDPETFEMLRRNTRTVWLKASVDDHWERVMAQGDFRPSADRPHARQELERRLARHSRLLSSAQLVLDTSAATEEQAVEDLAAWVADSEGNSA